MVDSAEVQIEPTCPECGGPVDYMPTCHTWPQRRENGTEQWMSCLPCSSATHWYCDNDESECQWSWDAGLNPRNPRAEANAAKAPPWADRGNVFDF